MTAPAVENESNDGTEVEVDQTDTESEVDDSKDENQLSDYWRGELTRARSEAGNYRTQLREAQSALKEAKTPEEFAAATAELNDKINKLERQNLVNEVGHAAELPAELISVLQGNTKEELEAHAKTLSALLAPAAQKATVPARPPRGGLKPDDDPTADETDPAKLAMAVVRSGRRTF